MSGIPTTRVLALQDCGYNERWLHDQIYKNPSLLNLGVQEMALRPEDFDGFTAEATALQVNAIRLCYSLNRSDLPLAEQLGKPLHSLGGMSPLQSRVPDLH